MVRAHEVVFYFVLVRLQVSAETHSQGCWYQRLWSCAADSKLRPEQVPGEGRGQRGLALAGRALRCVGISGTLAPVPASPPPVQPFPPSHPAVE